MKFLLKFRLADGPVSGETVSTDAEGMYSKGHWLRGGGQSDRESTLTVDGIKATKILSDEGIAANVTSVGVQTALLAAGRSSSVRLSDDD